MTRLSLKNSIFMGFGSILVLLGLLAFMALRGTNTIGHDFTEYRQAARESLLVNAANDALLHARLEVMQYRVTNDAQSAAEVERYLANLSEFKAQLIAFTTDPQRAAAVNQLDESVRAYQDAFARVVELQTTRNTLAPQLNQTGRAARSAISQIIETSNQAGNAQATYLAGLVQQHLMLASYYGERFLLENATSDQERTLSEIGLANTSASLLGAAIETRDARALFDTYTSNVDAFASLFAQVSDVIIARNAILADELDQIGPQLAQGYASILTAVVETQNTVGPRASAEVASVSRTTMMIAAVALAFGLIVAFFIGRMLTRSISSVVARMKQLAEGQLDITIDGTQRKDELGDMARALLVFQDNGREKIRLEAEQVAQAQEAEAEKRRSMHAMADGFEATVNEVVAGVSSAAQQMVGLAQTMSDAARRANERSSAVAAASEEASTNVETVAAASEEMTNSIAEVSERIGQSASMTDEAARGAERTTQTVSKLATSAQTIGDVISMISAIAEQTNLLALNATIEAARAGEAGKGFAVVASEVKSLANQTAKATEQISAQITTMQGDTDAVVEAIDKIGTMIQDLNSTSASIAAAVEEQHSATQEIARNTQQAADGTREVSANITEVSMAVQETGQAASDVLAASSQLASEADRLRDNVAQFLNKVRAA